jgi:hypothetical protein
MRDHHATYDTDHIVAAVPLTARTRHSPTPATAPPLPTVPEHHRTHRAVYALARIDASGRIADHTTTDALCWHPGDGLIAIPDNDHLITVRHIPHGHLTVSPKRHIVLPAPLRHRCGIHPGDPLFLAAYPDQACVLIGTQNWLDTLLAGVRPRARTEENSP